MPFIQEKARVSQYPEFMAGGDFLVGHELMSRHTGYGYYSPEMVKLIPNEEERFRFFASIGAKSYEELCRIAAPHQMPRNMLMYVSGLADKFLETEKSKDTPSMTAKDALVVLNVADITCKDWFTLDDHMIKHRAWAIRIGHPDPNFTLSISESRARSNLNSLVERGLLICDDSSEPYRYRLTRRGKSAARRAAIDAIAKHADSVIHKAHTNLAELGRQRLAVEAAMDDRAYLPAYLGKHMSRVKPGKNPENALRVIELSNLYNARSFTLEEYIENYRIVVRENPLLGFDKDISKSAARADLKALAVRGLLNITKRKGAYVYAITHDGIRSLANLIPHINTHVEVLESVLRNVHELPNSDIINIFGALLLAGHNLDEQLKALNDMLKWQKDVLEPLDILSIAAVKLAAGYKREEQIRIMEEWLKDEALGYREELKIRVALLEAGHRKEAQIRAINRVLREEGEGLSSHDRITVHGAFLLAGYRRTANIEVLDKMLSAKLSSREHARVRAAFLAARYQTHEQLDKLVQTLRWHHSAINPSEAIEIRYALIRHYVRERALISKGVELLGAEKRGVLTVYAAVLSAQTPSEPDIEVMMRDYEVRKESNARFHILDAAKIGWYLVRKTEGWTRELDESGSGGITPSIIAHRNPIREGDKAVAEFEDARLKIRTAAIDAKDVGANAIPTHVNDRYTLIVDNNLYADGEMKADIAGYDVDGRHIGAADRFNLVAADTSNVANIIAQIQDPSKTVVQLSGGLKKDDVKRLLAAKPGLRVVNVDTKGFKYDSTINKKLRWCFRFDLYAMMLAARRITEEDLKSKNTAIYRTLKFFLNTHFGDGNENIADEYIKAILNQTEEDIILIIKRALSYVPTGKWRIFEYHSVAATLITEQYL
jgi:predicted transcriptional regulator